jgi:hypothetical protein
MSRSEPTCNVLISGAGFAETVDGEIYKVVMLAGAFDNAITGSDVEIYTGSRACDAADCNLREDWGEKKGRKWDEKCYYSHLDGLMRQRAVCLRSCDVECDVSVAASPTGRC